MKRRAFWDTEQCSLGVDDVSEVHTAFIIMVMRQYAVSIYSNKTTWSKSQMALIFILAAMRTQNLTQITVDHN
jgi:hypothetical protein